MRDLNSLGKIKCKIGVLADDLTGASDVGVQFRRAGFNVTVLIQNESVEEALLRSEVVVIDTESRHLDACDAYAIANKTVLSFIQHDISTLYKKVDSTLRGNIGAELDGVMDAMGINLCIFAPAFPINGRTTLDGYQFLDGILIENTEVGKDILSPIQLSYIPSIIAAQSRRETAVISLDTVRKGETDLAKSLTGLAKQGKEIIIIDAESQNDLHLVAGALKFSGLSYLASGSAGFAAELPKAIDVGSELYKGSAVKRDGGVLAVVGSANITSAQQVLIASQDPSVNLIQLEVEKHILGPDNEDHLEKTCNEVIKRLAKGFNVLLSVGNTRSGTGGMEESKLILQSLAQIARVAVDSNSVYGLVLTGGDTAVTVFQALGAVGLDVLEEVSPGIPIGCIIGGRANGMPVVTKAGGFGFDNALIGSIHRVRRGVY